MATREREVAPPEFFDLATPSCPSPTLAVGAAFCLGDHAQRPSATTKVFHGELSLSLSFSPPLITRPFLFYFLFSRRLPVLRAVSNERSGVLERVHACRIDPPPSWIVWNRARSIVRHDALFSKPVLEYTDKNWISLLSTLWTVKILSGGYGERLERVVVLFRKLKVKSMGSMNGESRDRCANARLVRRRIIPHHDNECFKYFESILDRNLLDGKIGWI